MRTLRGAGHFDLTSFVDARHVRLSHTNEFLHISELQIFGEMSTNVILSTSSSETLVGTAGIDAFVFVDGFGLDVITNFEIGAVKDNIDLSAVTGILNFSDMTNNHLTQSGNDAVIADGSGDTITLVGINVADLTDQHFVFF